MMIETKEMDGDFARIGGVNFQGEMTFSKDVMKIDITEFKKGSILSVEIDNSTMQKQFKRYLIFTQVDRLFKEIVCCQNLEVSDQGCLILPIEVTFKEEILPLKIEIPLEEMKFQSQAEKLPFLYMKLAKLNKYYSSLQKQRYHWRKQIQGFRAERQKFQIEKSSTKNQVNVHAQPILFKPTKNEGNYIVVDNILKVISTSISCHSQTLPKQGAFYYKFKILNSSTKSFHAGLCGKNIVNLPFSSMLTSDYYMGLYLNNGYYYAYGTSIQGPKPYSIKEGSVIKVLINMNERTVMWYIDDKPVYLAMMRQTLFDVFLYPVVIVVTANDRIQFLEN